MSYWHSHFTNLGVYVLLRDDQVCMCVCVCVCGMCDVRPLTGARLSVRDVATHTHPKAQEEEGEVIKPLIARLWSLGLFACRGQVLCLTGAGQTTLGHLTHAPTQSCKDHYASFWGVGGFLMRGHKLSLSIIIIVRKIQEGWLSTARTTMMAPR